MIHLHTSKTFNDDRVKPSVLWAGFFHMDWFEPVSVYSLATQQIDIDLDDAVKVNSPKFGKVLKKIMRLN